MNIHQFNMQFDPEQDRILFRLNTVNKEEFRFYLTRRFVKLLWQVLIRILEEEHKVREPEKAHFAKDFVEFEHEKVVSSANFQQKYSEDVNSFPLGEKIILLTGIKVKQQPNTNILCLFSSNGKGIEFQVDSKFIHIFCEILKNIIVKAEWDLDFIVAGNKQAKEIQSPNRTLH